MRCFLHFLLLFPDHSLFKNASKLYFLCLNLYTFYPPCFSNLSSPPHIHWGFYQKLSKVWDLPFLQVTCTLTTTVLCHGCWQKTGDFWVGIKGLILNSTSSRHGNSICLLHWFPRSQFPQSPKGVTWRGPGDTCTHSELSYRRRTTVFYIGHKSCLLMS